MLQLPSCLLRKNRQVRANVRGLAIKVDHQHLEMRKAQLRDKGLHLHLKRVRRRIHMNLKMGQKKNVRKQKRTVVLTNQKMRFQSTLKATRTMNLKTSLRKKRKKKNEVQRSQHQRRNLKMNPRRKSLNKKKLLRKHRQRRNLNMNRRRKSLNKKKLLRKHRQRRNLLENLRRMLQLLKRLLAKHQVNLRLVMAMMKVQKCPQGRKILK
nr:hypothetical protein Iba_chr03bCG11070 [Ipomoea batatas]